VTDGSGATPVGHDALPALLAVDVTRPGASRSTERRAGDVRAWMARVADDPRGRTEPAPEAAGPVLAGETITAEAARSLLLPPDLGNSPAGDVASLAAVGVDNVVAPLPPAALTGLPALAGLWAVRQWRRLRRGT
jgi:hypothetical protein